ncbi:EAL domain-containing protein [Arsukibacterium sp.]|uniref:EAL domain-containing protein n=1 Tax=Arsukibacterium sp. TaxID=1977258 RepID=UPI00299F0249|nr:EAL domain-containing protein [Arsukibacterium sp.]MDX1677345.1 EAL domain-containing protein [Arsukibacterium sp.]
MDSNKWRAMQVKYRQNLSHKAKTLQQLWYNIQLSAPSSAWQELLQISHQLAGSGAIYGFPEVSRLAQALHSCLKHCEKDAELSNKAQALLHDLLAELENIKTLTTNEVFTPVTDVPAKPAKFKVVFADDDADLLAYHTDALTQAGFEIIPLTDIRLLAKTVAEHQPLAAICDMKFPEGETAGADHLQQVREQQGVSFPVLFISAFDTFENRLAAVRAGSSHFLAKPLSSKNLCQLLTTLLRKAEQDPYRVMLVDDDSDVLRFYRQVLQLAGYKVICCKSPRQALELMLAHQPELVLIDLHMPGCHGLEFGQIIRQHSELIDTPLIFMSADESIDEKLAAVRLAGDEFVNKPIATWRLLMMVEARVKRSRLLRQQKRQLMRQPELAQHLDTLTALPTLWQLHQDIEALLLQQQPFYLLKLDLNKFHLVNDIYGHQTGDLLLQTVAWKLMQQIRSADQLYRQNGDEFWVLLKDASTETAKQIAESLLLKLSESPGTLIADLNLTASIGMSYPETFTESSELLIQQVNIALHQAKAQQGYQIQCFNSAMQSDLSKRYQLQQSIRQALNQRAFSPVFQPIVDAENQLYSVELLSRWHHPQQGYVSPDVFIPLLEEAGIICQLTRQMLRTGLTCLRQWRETVPELKLSINFSAADFACAELAENLKQLVTEFSLPASVLIIEITENLLLDNSERLNQQLQKLKVAGFSIALDDFGTGYSSLSYLDRYPVDIVKIDRSFITKLDDPKARRLTLAIIHLAQELCLQITAEGIETPEQLNVLSTECCQHFQGFYFSKPLTAAELLESRWFKGAEAVKPG